MANRKRNIQMNFYVTENKKRLIDERIKLLASYRIQYHSRLATN